MNEKIPIGVSLDGPREVHDKRRRTKSGEGSFDLIVRNIKTALKVGLDPGALAVISPGVDGGAVYRFFENLGIKRISFLIPAQNWKKPIFPSGSGKTPIADYLIPAFDAWLASEKTKIRVYLFDATIRAIYGLHPGLALIGGTPAEWIVFTPDGSVEMGDCYGICDFKTVWRKDPLDAIRIAEQSELYRLQKTGGFIPSRGGCRECPVVEICKGGFLPHRYSNENGFDNPSYYCADLKKIFTHISSRVSVIDPQKELP